MMASTISVEGITGRGIDIQILMWSDANHKTWTLVCSKEEGCLSDQVSHRLIMLAWKTWDPLSGTEHDMVPERTRNEVRIEAQLLHVSHAREPFILGDLLIKSALPSSVWRASVWS